jgi:HlyD family secretion protein
MNRLAIAGIAFAGAAAAATWIVASSGGSTDQLTGVRSVGSGPATRSRAAGVLARALGKIEAASEEIGVSSDLTGRIAEILVDEGDRVEKGAALVKLEPFVYSSRVEAAKAAVAHALARKKLLELGAREEEIEVAKTLLDEIQSAERLARSNWDRTKRLIDQGIVSESERDGALKEFEAFQARVTAARMRVQMALRQTRPEELEAGVAELDQRKHELAMSEAELEKTVLRAPISGTIIRKNMRVGEAVSSFQVSPVVTLADMSKLRVRAEVDEVDIAKVKLGQPVEVHVLSRPEKSLVGKVIRLGKTMGRRKVESNDPNEREDVRILEVLVEITDGGDEDLPLGLRTMVTFLETGAGG